MQASVSAFLAGFDAKQRFLSMRWLSEGSTEPELHWLDALCPATLKATEALDAGFSATLRCFLPVGVYPLERLLGRTLALCYPAVCEVRLHVGLVSAVSVEGESAGYLWLELGLQDGFALLKHNRRSAVFNELNALQITERVFERLARQSAAFARLMRLDAQSLADSLSPQSHPPLAFTLQYEESDFAFLTRLWRREGWHWHIEARQSEGEGDGSGFQALVLSAGTQAGGCFPLFSTTVRMPRKPQTRCRFFAGAVRCLPHRWARAALITAKAERCSPPSAKQTHWAVPMQVCLKRRLSWTMAQPPPPAALNT